MNDDEKIFWMVWSPQGRAPTVRHPSNGRAISEAERLARDHPGRQFFVLQATQLRMVQEPMVRVTLDDGVPF